MMVDELCRWSDHALQIAAHSTRPPALYALEDDVDAWWTEPREERWVAALAETGVALGDQQPHRLPHDACCVARWKRGPVSLGIDGHRLEQVAGWLGGGRRRGGWGCGRAPLRAGGRGRRRIGHGRGVDQPGQRERD